jgi:hypothetical protein
MFLLLDGVRAGPPGREPLADAVQKQKGRTDRFSRPARNSLFGDVLLAKMK